MEASGDDQLLKESSSVQQPNFALPVDSEHKATEFRLFSVAKPHMSAFHLSWLSFFSCFVSTFAAPPLLPIIRDNLNLTTSDIGNAGVASVSGAVFARIAMGTACDLVGSRLACASLILLTAPAVFFTSIISSPTSFLLVRFFTGFSLCTFVSTQFWMSSMFTSSIVGSANGFAAGWGNLGGGATQLIMPLVFDVIRDIGSPEFTAWRIAFFIPALFQMFTAFLVLILGQDLPDGNYYGLKKSGEKAKDDFSRVLYHGVTNYRGWILGLTYGYCFGVELTVDNIIAQYFFDRFNLKLHTAGMVAASFGLANAFARPAGGFISDFMARRFGMRGRLWALWLCQTLGGIFCIILGLVGTLEGSIVVMIIFSVFVQAAAGFTFGVVPFVSRRSLGVISGMTGGGGSMEAVLTQLIFFRGHFSTQRGITLMGVMIVLCTLPISLIHFPSLRGVACCGAHLLPLVIRSPLNMTYLSEWNSMEQQKGSHLATLNFADNSRSERGRRFMADHDSSANNKPSLEPTPTTNTTFNP